MVADFRLVSATNRALDEMVKGGRFRNDLLFRLRAFTIDVPPLRERREDIKELTLHRTARLCEQYGTETKGFSPDFFDALTAYDWPGNVRELFNALERALAAAQHESVLCPYHLPPYIRLIWRAADAAKNTANLIEGTVKKVKDGADLVTRTNHDFSEVVTSASRVGELVGEIAAASNEQSLGFEQINNAVAEMDKVVQQNAATAEESASASEELNAQAEEMKSFVADLAAMVGGNAAVLTGSSRTLKRPKVAGHARQAPQRALTVTKKPATGKAVERNRSKEVRPDDIIPMDENDFKDF